MAETADTLAALAASELPVQEEEDGAQAVEPAEKKKKKKKKQAEDSEMAEAAGELCVLLITTSCCQALCLVRAHIGLTPPPPLSHLVRSPPIELLS